MLQSCISINIRTVSLCKKPNPVKDYVKTVNMQVKDLKKKKMKIKTNSDKN